MGIVLLVRAKQQQTLQQENPDLVASEVSELLQERREGLAQESREGFIHRVTHPVTSILLFFGGASLVIYAEIANRSLNHTEQNTFRFLGVIAALAGAASFIGKNRGTLPNLMGSSPGETKTCPDCAEDVKAAARKCKHCGFLFEETDVTG